MTFRASSPRARPRWAALILVAGALTVLGITSTLAHTTINTIPGNFFTVVDQQGVNDVNSDQVDLTQFGRDDTDATRYQLFWSWDSTSSWTGSGQTGDACALFDTGSDGKIDYAVCARVTNPGANADVVEIVPQDATHPIFLFSCGNQKVDRCAQPKGPLAYVQGAGADAGVIGTLAKANLITDTDPFPAGQASPHDTTIQIDVLKSLVGGGTLVNVCSYPSAGNGGNNNPFDCITTPGGGFLKIVKDAGSDTSTNFVFAVAPAPVAPQPAQYTITGSGATGNIGIAITNSGSVTETVPATWNLTGATCTREGGASTGTFSSATSKVTGIAIESGRLTTCTFTNRLQTGQLVVIKHVVNDDGGTATADQFTYTLGDGSSATAEAGAESPGTSYSRTVGTTYDVEENAGGPGGYDVSYSADCSGAIVAGTTKTCTITNDDRAATLIVKKVVVNDNGGTGSATDFAFEVNDGAAIDFLQDGANAAAGKNTLSVDAGTYTVVEADLPVAGYSTTYDNCSDVVIANGETATCTITNDDQAFDPTGETEIGWKVNDSASFTIRPGADDAAAAEITFRLYKDADGELDANTCTAANLVGQASTSGVTLTDAGTKANGASTDYVVEPGTYFWIAAYSGDAFNNPASTACGFEVTTIE